MSTEERTATHPCGCLEQDKKNSIPQDTQNNSQSDPRAEGICSVLKHATRLPIVRIRVFLQEMLP